MGLSAEGKGQLSEMWPPTRRCCRLTREQSALIGAPRQLWVPRKATQADAITAGCLRLLKLKPGRFDGPQTLSNRYKSQKIERDRGRLSSFVTRPHADLSDQNMNIVSQAPVSNSCQGRQSTIDTSWRRRPERPERPECGALGSSSSPAKPSLGILRMHPEDASSRGC